jgi:phage terminase small subunit
VALSAKQQRFVAEYLKDLNATQATVRAGYSVTSAHVTGSRLLSDAKISAAIAFAQAEIAKSHGVSMDWLIERYKRIADADTRKFYDENGNLKAIKDLDDASAYALAGVETDETTVEGRVVSRIRKIKRWDPIKALDSLGRHLGMFAADNSRDVNVNITLETLITASQEPVTIEQNPLHKD